MWNLYKVNYTVLLIASAHGNILCVVLSNGTEDSHTFVRVCNFGESPCQNGKIINVLKQKC